MNPCKRRIFIKRLKKIGFIGPYTGTKHEFMTYKNHRIAIPSNKEYSSAQIMFMLREIRGIIDIDITNDEFESL